MRRIDRNGLITTVAGNGSAFSSGDGGLAINASLQPVDLALLADGSILVSDLRSHTIRRFTPGGTISKFAGTGSGQLSGDGGMALQAGFSGPFNLAVGPDGSIFVTDIVNDAGGGSFVMRRISPSGLISSVPAVRGGSTVFAGTTMYVGIGPRIWKYEPGKLPVTFAGGGSSSEDGVPATDAFIVSVQAITAGPDGSIYFVGDGGGVRRISPQGIITTLAGPHTPFVNVGFKGDQQAALDAQFARPTSVAVTPDGKVLVSDTENHRLRLIGVPLPAATASEVSIPSPQGNELYVFTRTGQHLRTYDTRTGAQRFTFGYTANGDLVTITDAYGNITTIERGSNGQPQAIVAPGGQQTVLAADDNGNVNRIANAETSVTATFGPGGLMGSFDDALTHTAFEYDSLGRFASEQNSAGAATSISRIETSAKTTTTLSSGLGRSLQFELQRAENGDDDRTLTDATGLKTFTHRSGSAIMTTSVSDGMTATSTFQSDPRLGLLSPVLSTLSIRTPAGLQFSATRSRQGSSADPQDPLSFAAFTDTWAIDGKPWSNTFDRATRTATIISPLGRRAAMIFDPTGNVVSVTRGGASPASVGYDVQGRPNILQQGIHHTEFGYDTKNNVATITVGGRSFTFEHDDAGRVRKQTLPDGRTMTFTYDAAGNVHSITPPGKPAHLFTFGAGGLQSGYITPLGSTTSFTYNGDRQLTSMQQPDGAVTLTYDTGGRLSAVTGSGGTTQYTYSPTTGHLTQIDGDGSSLQYSYDGMLRTSESWSGVITGSVSLTYDSSFRVQSRRVNQRAAIAFGYDDDGLLLSAGNLTLSRDGQTGFTHGTVMGNVTDAFSFDSVGGLASYGASYAGSAIYEEQLRRDDTGRITQVTELLSGSPVTVNYTYNGAGRLETVTQDGQPARTYKYDANGNRLSKTITAVESSTYDDDDRLLTRGAVTYNYTAGGALHSMVDANGTTTYDYDVFGSLRHVALPDGRSLDYVMDALHRRIAKKIDGTLVRGWTYDDADRIIAEFDGAGALRSEFVYASRSNIPDYILQGSDTFRILADHRGSPRVIINISTGFIAQELGYDEFGNVLTGSSPFQPFGFAGGLYDSDTGLVRFGVRDYDPKSGRWTAKDPKGFAGGDTNLYGYVMNDPINLIDPMGTDWLDTTSNAVAGFGDTVSFGASRWAREKIAHAAFGQSSGVNQCSTSYRLGQVGGVLWWTAFGGAVGDEIAGVNVAEKELGNITLQTAEYEQRLAGLSEAEKLAELGGARGALAQSLRNAASPGWWGTVARTTLMTGPTPGGWGGLVGLGVGGASVATSAGSGCGCQ